jgi:hypothetical protein
MARTNTIGAILSFGTEIKISDTNDYFISSPLILPAKDSPSPLLHNYLQPTLGFLQISPRSKVQKST